MPRDLELNYKYFDISFDPSPNNIGDVSIVTNKDAIKQSLISIFNTPKGSRIMLPEFGCDVHSYLFEPYDEITARALATEIQNSFEYFEPRIRIIKIYVELDPDVSSQVYNIEILYEIKNDETDSLTLTLEKL